MKYLSAILLTMLIGNVNAATLTFGPVSAGGSGPNVTIPNIVTPTSSMSDATITLNVNGDFNSSYENAVVSLDTYGLGTILDNNSANDLFNFSGDAGNQSTSTVTGSATISKAIFNTLIADGFLNLFFNTTSSVNCCGTLNILSGSITFRESSPSQVPVPAAVWLFGTGLAGLMGASRKKKQVLVA